MGIPFHGFGRRVRHLRTERGWTLERLAESAKLHRTAIGLLEREERDPSLSTALAIADALDVPIQQLIETGTAPESLSEGPPPRVPTGLRLVETPEALQGLTSANVVEAIQRTYSVLDMIDDELMMRGSPPLPELLELANLSAVVGQIFGGELAAVSDGVWERNGPHKHPDLIRVGGPRDVGIEIKVALENNNAKGHLPKAGAYLTLHYMLTSRDPNVPWTLKDRGNQVSIWMVKSGYLEEPDFNCSNTDGDSGKTAVINAAARDRMDTAYFDPELCPMPSLKKKLLGGYDQTARGPF